jgi:deoxycytidylate deaminase
MRVSYSSGNGGRASGRTARRISINGLSSPAMRFTCTVEHVGAAVHERPLAVVAGGYADWLHGSGTVRCPVAWDVVIDMQAPKAVRAVVVVLGAWRLHRDIEAAAAAAEAFRSAAAVMGTAMGHALVARQAETSDERPAMRRAGAEAPASAGRSA